MPEEENRDINLVQALLESPKRCLSKEAAEKLYQEVGFAALDRKERKSRRNRLLGLLALVVGIILLCYALTASREDADRLIQKAYPQAKVLSAKDGVHSQVEYTLCDQGRVLIVKVDRERPIRIRDWETVRLDPATASCK